VADDAELTIDDGGQDDQRPDQIGPVTREQIVEALIGEWTRC
jgi:hypothetical protein